MSEWINCPRCGTLMENLCACPNPQCADFAADKEPSITIDADLLITRLRSNGWWVGDIEARKLLLPILAELKTRKIEGDGLVRWKMEQLAVTAWWQTIDDYCRKHSEIALGVFVSAFALQKIQERDEMAAALRDFKSALEQLPQHLAFGSEARAVITTVINRCEILTSPKPVPVQTVSTS